MKVVCMCQGGNSRSVGCAYLLKYYYGMDALACGWEKNTPETLDMLFSWAEGIIVMQEEFTKYVPEKYKEKLYVADVGPDIWCNSLHPDLLNKCNEQLTKIIFGLKQAL
jgi:predicted protein tyrosine phosphatase